MIKMFLKLFNWLDKRFPTELVVSVEDYQALKSEVRVATEKSELVEEINKGLTLKVLYLEDSLQEVKNSISKKVLANALTNNRNTF